MPSKDSPLPSLEAVLIIGFLYGIQSDFLPKDEVRHRMEVFKHTKGYAEALAQLERIIEYVIGEESYTRHKI